MCVSIHFFYQDLNANHCRRWEICKYFNHRVSSFNILYVWGIAFISVHSAILFNWITFEPQIWSFLADNVTYNNACVRIWLLLFLLKWLGIIFKLCGYGLISVHISFVLFYWLLFILKQCESLPSVLFRRFYENKTKQNNALNNNKKRQHKRNKRQNKNNQTKYKTKTRLLC